METPPATKNCCGHHVSEGTRDRWGSICQISTGSGRGTGPRGSAEVRPGGGPSGCLAPQSTSIPRKSLQNHLIFPVISLFVVIVRLLPGHLRFALTSSQSFLGQNGVNSFISLYAFIELTLPGHHTRCRGDTALIIKQIKITDAS